MIDLNSLVMAEKPSQEVRGTWYAVQWSPDPRTGERYNLGVAVIGDNGERGFKLLDSYTRLECIYGKESHVAFHAELVCQVVEQYLEDIDSDVFVSLNSLPQVFLEKRGVVKDGSLLDAASKMFDEMVPLGREVFKVEKSKPVSRAQICRGIRRDLKKRFKKISSVMPPRPYYTGEGVSKKLYLPVRNSNLVATFASARVSTSHTAKLNIYEAQQDISIASRLGLSRKNYLHLLLPDDDADEKQVVEIENQIDSVEFVLKKEGVGFMTHNNEEEIAEAVFQEYHAA